MRFPNKIFIFCAVLMIIAVGSVKTQAGSPLLDYAIKQFRADPVITIDAGHNLGSVNKLILGSSLFADGSLDTDGFMNYGGGIYDPAGKKLVTEVIDLVKQGGISLFRFPGGSGVDHYDWKRTFWDGRDEFLFGIDEFMKACEAAQAEPIYTISYFTGTAEDAADLVEYLNAPNNGSNPNGGTDWAQVRANKGRLGPYNVKYFELGNETFNGHKTAGEAQEIVQPADYANDYLIYKAAMKAVDPNIKLGLSLDTLERNRIMFGILQDQIDFGIGHTYPSPSLAKESIEVMAPDAVFLATYTRPYVLDLPFMKTIQDVYEQETGITSGLPLFITELNIGLEQDVPVPYRHSLGAALLMADMLRMFMQPENKIMGVNQTYLLNEYWGMLQSATPYRTHDYSEPIIYQKRPSFYVYELYSKNFGDTLVETQVTSPSYQLEDWLFAGIKATAEVFLVEPNDPNPPAFDVVPTIPYLTANASVSSDGKNLYLMVVNRSPHEHLTARLNISNFGSIAAGQAWILNGEVSDAVSFEAINEKDNPYTVRLKHKKITIPSAGEPLEFRFERHSVTSIILSKNNLDDLWSNNSLDKTLRFEGANGVVNTFNPDGTLTIESPNDPFWRVRLYNTEDGGIIWAKDKEGIEYSSMGDGTYIGTKPDGQKFEYDQSFNVIGFVNADGTIFTYNSDGTITGKTTDGTISHYTSAWKIISIHGTNGHANYFDGNGKIIRSEDAQGNVFVFNSDGTITATQTDGMVIVYTSSWTKISIDFNGNHFVFNPDGTITGTMTDGFTNVYTSGWKLLQRADTAGQTVYFNADGTVARYIDSAGNIFVFNPDTTITATMANGLMIVFNSNWVVISVTPPA